MADREKSQKAHFGIDFNGLIWVFSCQHPGGTIFSDMMESQSLFARAFGLHQAGALAQAESLYRQILAVQPSHFQSRHLLGVVCAQQARNQEAIDLIAGALSLNPQWPEALINYANVLRAAGRPSEALASIDKALSLQPAAPAALSNRAVILTELGRNAEALESADQALRFNPNYAQALYNRGNALRALTRFAEAIASYDRALAVSPSLAEGWVNRGITLLELGDLEEAGVSFHRALMLRPNYADAHLGQGNALRAQGHLAQALESYDRALTLRPDHADTLVNRGVVLAELERADEALQCFDRALALQPHDAEALYNRGRTLADLLRPQEAMESYDRALAVQPGHADTLSNRGVVLASLGRHAQALESYDRALAIKPIATSLSNRGNSLVALKRFDDALASFDQALALNPSHPGAHWNKSLCLLLLGRFAQAWPLHEWRKKLAHHASLHPYEDRLWHGAEDISGKTLLVYSEQGLGDIIQFCRYLPLVAARGAKVVFSVRDPLVRLMQSFSRHGVTVAPRSAAIDFDYATPLMSLPLALGIFDPVPASAPYLYAEPERIALWRDRIGSAGLRVGISWQGSGADQGTAIPLRSFEAMAQIPNVRLISLQKNEGSDQLRNLPPGMKVETLGADFDAGPEAFLDTAAVMETLDLIITIDTSIAHLAGALGRPAWVALKHVPDWRWLLDRADSDWYPTLKLFRQPADGDWSGLVAQMTALLQTGPFSLE